MRDNIARIVYEINEMGFILWLDGENLNYRQYSHNIDSAKVKDYIKANKEKIISFLRLNNIFKCLSISPTNPYIYKCINLETELSYGQERLWFIDRYEVGTYAYNIPILYKLKERVNAEVLERSISSIIDRHEILRTVIREDQEGNNFQQVLDIDSVNFKLQKIKIQNKIILNKKIKESVTHVFNLGEEIPIKSFLFSDNRNKYICIIIHHIAFDGWSLDIFLSELLQFYKYYSNLSKNNTAELKLPELNIQYKDFAVWQKYYLKDERLKKYLNYWRYKLDGYETLNLVTDKVRPQQFNYNGKSIYFNLGTEFSEDLRGISKSLGVSLYTVLLSAYYLTLKAYSNQDDIVLGTPVANRHYSQVEHLIGFFVNNLVLRIKINESLTIKAFIELIGREVIEAQLYQDLPFEKLVNELRLEQDTSRHPIFQVLFVLDNFGKKQNEGINNLLELCEITDEIHGVAQFDISTIIDDSNNEISGRFNYATSLFEKKTIRGYIETYKEILTQIVKFSKKVGGLEAFRVCDLSYVNDKTCEKLLNRWNSTDSKIELDRPVIEIFEERVKEFFDSVAVIYGNKHITYSELNKRSNSLASYIVKKYEIKPENSIAIYLDRSEYIILSILAILKTGASYIPIDPSYPNYRTEYIIKDTKAKVIITHGAYKDKLLSITGNDIKNLEDINIIFNNIQSRQDNLNIKVSLNNIAYIMYTSGTTGTPKGTMVSNIAYIELIFSVKNKHLRKKKRINTYSVTNYVFDIFGLEYGIPLVSGGVINIGGINFTNLDCSYYDFIQLTPSLCEVKLLEMKNLDGVKLFIGGEELRKNLLLDILKSGVDIVNMYGPVETCIWSTSKEYNPKYYGNFMLDYVSIGKPLTNEKVYVLGRNLEVLPIGAVGELYIGGIGLGSGYINKQDLTAEKFIANPFRTEKGLRPGKDDRIYKTGDIVKWLPDGDLVYIGRADSQVKIRGHRIELCEIESVLQSHKDINQCKVTLYEQKSPNKEVTKNIVGYYVTSKGLKEEELLAYLSSKLPEYMIPNTLIKVEKIPLTLNGKIDKKALPIPRLHKEEPRYVVPSNEIEKKICKVWSKILGINEEKISVFDNFFKLGGNSILAIKLINFVNREFHSNVEIKSIYDHNNIRKLSKLVVDTKGNFKYTKFQILNLNEQNKEDLYKPFSLTNSQQAYYIGRSNGYELGNVSTHIYVEYKFEYLDINRLEQSLNKLIDRHHALRTVFEGDSQRYLGKYEKYKIRVNKNIDDNYFNVLRNKISKKLYDPRIYPLFDFQVSILNNCYILHISFDALIMDDSSFEILLKEWTILYREKNPKLPKLYISFRDYLINYNIIRNSSLYLNAKEYWSKKLYQYNFNMMLPLKAIPYEVKVPNFKRITKIIPRSIWNSILSKSNRARVSPTSVVLEIFGQILSYWTGQSKLCINLTLFDRLPLHEQVNNIIGDFTILGLFDYDKLDQKTAIFQKLKSTHNELWRDIENNLFDGIDFQRLIRQKQIIKNNQIVGPVVLTSTIGNISNQNSGILDNSYLGINYSITQTSQVWLDNKAYETKEGFIAEWDYVEQLFDQELMSNMHNSYCVLLERLSLMDWEKEFMPDIIIPAKDMEIINNANSFKQNISTDTLFSRCINKVESRSLEEKIAVIDTEKSESYSYEKLLKESRLLAGYLNGVAMDINSGKLIAILSEKGYNQVLGTFAIMQSGHGYLPLDIEWPILRIIEVLSQSEAAILVISKIQYNNLVNLLPGHHYTVIIEDIINSLNDNLNLILYSSQQNLPDIRPEDIAYVIYTSGSTGKPKGVVISHRGALNTIDAVNNRFNISSQDKVLALSRLSFDLSVYDIYGVLAVGGTIIFPNNIKINDPGHWSQLVNKYQITIWNTVPQLADLFIDSYLEQNYRFHIRIFLLSGDWIPLNLFDKIKKCCSVTEVISLGGATEGSIWSIWYRIIKHKKFWKSVPYGLAMPNQKVYILNNSGQHCPVGVIGYIYIGGIGVALSYWQDNDKTNASFINHNKLGRLYKTGDLGRWNKNGYIEFIGRQDNQVKINGYRIELEEISSKLTYIPGIKQAVVKLQKDNNNSYLVGYLLSSKKLEYSKIIDQNAFKLELRCLIKNLVTDYKFDLLFDEIRYRNRKSYRNFINTKIPIEKLELIYQQFLSEGLNGSVDRLSSIYDLQKILSSISALTIKNRTLPKYLYPSAGSTYSIRCFINIPYYLGYIEPGYYYYNPVSHSLNQYKRWNIPENNNFIEIHFVLYWPAIKPLYKHDSKRLAYIEAGHMIGIMQTEGIKFQIDILENELDKENTHIATLTFNNQQFFLGLKDLKINFLEKREEIFYDSNQERKFDLLQNDIFFRASYLGQQLCRSSIIVEVEGEKSINNYVTSGYLFQKFSEYLNTYNMGSCMLGLKLFSKSLYSMIIGDIRPEHKNDYESNIEVLLLKDIINKYLSRLLPTYMIPDDYIVLKKFPISANGKLEVNKLPLLKFKSQATYLLPRNEFEIKLSKLWSETLNLNPNKISITDNFFVLGGNSLLAMQMVRKANRELNINCTIKDLYELQTIEGLYKKFGDIKISKRVVGIV